MSAVKQQDSLARWSDSQPAAAGPGIATELWGGRREQPRAAQFVTAAVTGRCETSGHWLLACDAWNGGTLELQARPADGLLLLPAVDDQVLCVRMGQEWLITQLLLRASDAGLTYSTQRAVAWIAPRIQLSALTELELQSAGKLGCYGVDLVLAASRTFVQQARHLLQQAGDVAVTAKGLLRLSGKQQLITAQEDVRVDGKRISMG